LVDNDGCHGWLGGGVVLSGGLVESGGVVPFPVGGGGETGTSVVAVTLASAPEPALFMARTLNVYVTPSESPVNVCPVLLEAITQVVPLLLDTSYPVIMAPPLLTGAAQFSDTPPLIGVAVKF